MLAGRLTGCLAAGTEAIARSGGGGRSLSHRLIGSGGAGQVVNHSDDHRSGDGEHQHGDDCFFPHDVLSCSVPGYVTALCLSLLAVPV
ncbi:MAG: hypothetical protein KDE24_37265, partial [Caldilinea sp.]|nr:hypothetical protein [Caldilinea sp.]